jgi:hypothetical protein
VRLEPVDGVREVLRRYDRVGMAGMGRDETGQLRDGALHPVRRVAEHIDCPRCEVSRAHAFGEHEHPFTLFAQAQRRRESRHAGADHNRVIGHAGRCSTSSRP